VTRRWRRSARGSHRTRAAKTARSAPVQTRSRIGAAEHGDLMAQHEQLDISGGRAAQHQDRVGAENSVTSRDLQVFVYQAAEAVAS
jgi:hypothetical protein